MNASSLIETEDVLRLSSKLHTFSILQKVRPAFLPSDRQMYPKTMPHLIASAGGRLALVGKKTAPRKSGLYNVRSFCVANRKPSCTTDESTAAKTSELGSNMGTIRPDRFDRSGVCCSGSLISTGSGRTDPSFGLDDEGQIPRFDRLYHRKGNSARLLHTIKIRCFLQDNSF